MDQPLFHNGTKNLATSGRQPVYPSLIVMNCWLKLLLQYEDVTLIQTEVSKNP